MNVRLPIDTSELAAVLGAELIGPGSIRITGVAALHEAGEHDLSFVRSTKFAPAWAESRAPAAVVTRGVDLPRPPERALLIVDDADTAMITLLQAAGAAAEEAFEPGVHPTSVVHPSARVHDSASIGPNAVIDGDAELGAGARVGPGCHIGSGARVGARTVLRSNVSVGARCVIGRGCLVHPGVVIGADGFGFHPAPGGAGLVKIPHLGNVVVGDDVEIGANTCVDRAKFGSTTIGDGAKIDNLVQIAHNCAVGRSCIICGGSALAGSVRIGDGAVLGGRVSVTDGVSIGAGAKLAAGTGVMNDVPPGATLAGSPALPSADWLRQVSMLRRLTKDYARLRRLIRDDGGGA